MTRQVANTDGFKRSTLASHAGPTATPDRLVCFWLFSAVWWMTCIGIAALLAITFEQPTYGATTLVVMALAYIPSVLMTWGRVYSRYPIQKRLLTCTQILAWALITGGMLGVEF